MCSLSLTANIKGYDFTDLFKWKHFSLSFYCSYYIKKYFSCIIGSAEHEQWLTGTEHHWCLKNFSKMINDEGERGTKWCIQSLQRPWNGVLYSVRTQQLKMEPGFSVCLFYFDYLCFRCCTKKPLLI